MNRDPQNYECTRDPIFLLMTGTRQWTKIPDGIELDGSCAYVTDEDLIDDWIDPYIDEDGCVDLSEEFWKCAESEDNGEGWSYVHVEWAVESVFLTRPEAEEFAKQREYRWEKWKVYCVPCEGVLVQILRDYQPKEASQDPLP